MKLISLRNLPEELARIIRERARQRGLSLNKAVIDLLQEALGLRKGRPAGRLHDDLDALAGRWSVDEAAGFEKALARQREVDPEVWS